MDIHQCGNVSGHDEHQWWRTSPANPRMRFITECPGLKSTAEYWPPETLPQEAIDAYVEAWEAKQKEIGRGISEPGTKVRAGLSAALQVLYEKDVIG